MANRALASDTDIVPQGKLVYQKGYVRCKKTEEEGYQETERETPPIPIAHDYPFTLHLSTAGPEAWLRAAHGLGNSHGGAAYQRWKEER